METKLSNEDKATLFGMYLGSLYQDIDMVDGNAFATHLDENSICYAVASINSVLLLNPLSEISDSDAAELARLADVSYSNSRDDAYFDLYGLSEFIQNLFIDHIHYQPRRMIDIIDYLRSKSYALPYKGINLFECGIAINQPKTH